MALEFFFFVLWIILAVFIGAAASARGRSGIGWGLVSLLLSPILAGLLLLLFPSITNAPATAHIGPARTWRCPHCAEPVMFEAKVCPHCRLALPAHDPALLAQFPEVHNGHRYRRERDGSVLLLTPQGPRRFSKWSEFWTAVN